MGQSDDSKQNVLMVWQPYVNVFHACCLQKVKAISFVKLLKYYGGKKIIYAFQVWIFKIGTVIGYFCLFSYSYMRMRGKQYDRTGESPQMPLKKSGSGVKI